jgi:ABC-type transport system involved in cytochrome c biogenesis permease subunit
LITLPTTIYGWSYDQTILLIPIAQVFSWLTHSKYKVVIITFIIAVIAFNYYQRVLPFNEVYYVWVPLAWCFIFAFTWRSIPHLNERRA